MKKIALLTVAVLALGAVVVPASASALTANEILQALSADPALLSQLQALLGGTATTGGTSSAGSLAAVQALTKDLTIGSKGADVTALQTWLVEEGYMVMPVGVPMGYFGTLTQKALAQWQAENAVTPAAGYFGPKTRGVIATLSSTVTPGGTLPAGCTSTAGYSSTTGAKCDGSTTGSTTGGTISTPGVEGTLSATQSTSGISSTIYEGDDQVAILGVKLEADSSDIMVQRVKIDLGTTTKIYNKIYSKLYVTEGGNLLAEAALNSSTVVKESGRYYITISGFNLLVPKDGSKTVVIKADVYSSIDSTDRSAGDITLSWGVRLASNGFRGVDGAGIDQYAGTTSIGKSITISASLVESATLDLADNSSSPSAADVVAADGSANNELDKLTLLTFNLTAKKDDVTVTDLAIDIDKGGTGGATASTTVYLYEGDTELENATVDSSAANGSYVVFSSDELFTVSKDATKTLTVKVDVRNANGTVSTLSATASSSGITAENSQGDTVSVSGSATGESQYVRNVGPVFTLVSKSVERSVSTDNQISTTTSQATFTVKVKAVGGSITFGSVASTAPMFGSSTPYFVTYVNGAAQTLLVASSTDFSIPSSGVTTSGLDNSFTLAENNEVTIPVSFTFVSKTAAGANAFTGSNSVATALERIRWAGAQTTTFMAGDTDWRASSVTMP